MKSAGPLVLAAIVILALGGYAFASAPAEANRTTALAVPGFIALVFIALSVTIGLRERRGSARNVRIAAGVVAILFAGLVAFPAVMRTRAMTNWPGASLEWQEAVQRDPTLAERAAQDRAVRKAFFGERKSPDHDQRYLVITLWSITAVCTLTGIGLLVGRTRRTL